MRVLLRNTQTGLFYAGPDQWTASAADAKDFEQTDRALDLVAAAKLGAIQVLMRFEDPLFEIPLTVVGLQ